MRKYICDFGHRHEMNAECSHEAEYNTNCLRFRMELFNVCPGKYPSTITNSQRVEILKNCVNVK